MAKVILGAGSVEFDRSILADLPAHEENITHGVSSATRSTDAWSCTDTPMCSTCHKVSVTCGIECCVRWTSPSLWVLSHGDVVPAGQAS